jgi:hypothetical protein
MPLALSCDLDGEFHFRSLTCLGDILLEQARLPIAAACVAKSNSGFILP